MHRKLSREKTERLSPIRLEEEAQALRDRCYVWALTHAADLAAVYEKADQIAGLELLDDRARDLWEPLVSIAALADVERGDRQRTLTEELAGLARDLCQVRESAAEDSITARVVEALAGIAREEREARLIPSEEPVTLAPSQLAPLLAAKLGWGKITTKGLATLLNSLGLYSEKMRQEGKVIRAYLLKQKDLSELGERYGRTTEKGEEK